MSQFFGNILKHCKGKDLSVIAPSKLPSPTDKFIVTTKYDGNYVRIEKEGGNVRFFSRSKEFYALNVATEIMSSSLASVDFIIDTEYVGDMDGKLGDRRHSSLNSFISDFKKGKYSIVPGKFMIFDVLYFNKLLIDETAETRIKYLRKFKTQCSFRPVKCPIMEFRDTYERLARFKAHDWEGLYIKHIDSIYRPGKRVNDMIKLKHRPTIDVKCVAVTRGEGKYDGMIGSLECKYNGKSFFVGSGLTDAHRGLNSMVFIGQTIEVAYEQIMDNVPVQPTFVCIRDDKD